MPKTQKLPHTVKAFFLAPLLPILLILLFILLPMLFSVAPNSIPPNAILKILPNMLSYIGTFILLACLTAYLIGLLLFFPQHLVLNRYQLFSYYHYALIGVSTALILTTATFILPLIKAEPTSPIRAGALISVALLYFIPCIIGGLSFRYIAGNPIEDKKDYSKEDKEQIQSFE